MSGPCSERLQLKQLTGEVERKDFAVVYFVDEAKYSAIPTSAIIEPKFKEGDHVQLKAMGKRYSAKVIFVGSESSCEKRIDRIIEAARMNRVAEGEEDEEENVCHAPPAKKVKSGKGPKVSKGKEPAENLAFSWKEKVNEEQRKLEEMAMGSGTDDFEEASHNDEVVVRPEGTPRFFEELSTKVSHLESEVGEMQQKLDLIIGHLVKTGHNRPYSPTPSLATSRSSSPLPSTSRKEPDALEDLSFEDGDNYVYNGVNLLEEFGPSKDPKKYALRLMGILFSENEMMGGVVGPKKVNSQKKELDPVRVDLLKACIKRKYGEKTFLKSWSDIRISCNQKGCDLLKKKRRAESKNAPTKATENAPTTATETTAANAS